MFLRHPLALVCPKIPFQISSSPSVCDKICDLVVMSTRTVDHSSYTIVMVLEHPGVLVVIPLILTNTPNNCHRLCTRSLTHCYSVIREKCTQTHRDISDVLRHIIKNV